MASSFLQRHVRRLLRHLGWIALGVSFQSVVRALVPEAILRSGADVGGNFLQTFGGIYGIIVAFVFFVVWQQHNDTQIAVEKEAVALSELHRLLRTALSWTGRAAALERLEAYAVAVPALHGPKPCEKPVDDHRLLTTTLEAFLLWQPATPHEERLHGPTLELFHELNEAREHRITTAGMRLPEGLRAFVYIGAALCVLTLGGLWVDSALLHALFIAGMTWVVVAAVTLVEDLDDPYTGDFVVDWSRFHAAARRMVAREEP